MSKKCNNHNKLSCEGGSFRCPKTYPSSSKRRRSRCHRKSSLSRESSSRCSEKLKHTRKSRVEQAVEFECSEKESGTARSKDNLRRRTHRKGVKREKKRKKKIRKKKKSDGSKKRKLSGSSTCSRLIELLIKSCFCLKGLDSSSSSPPYSADTSSCYCCKCRFCRPDCNSKSIQCDDCDRPVAPSRRTIHDDAGNLGPSEKEGGADSTNRGAGKSVECVTRDKSGIACEESENDLQLDLRRGEAGDVLNARIRNKKNKLKTKFRGSLVESPAALKDLKKRQSAANPSINEFSIFPKKTTVECPKDCSISHEASKLVFPQNEDFCRDDDCNKSTKALLVMFDIVFWPRTCFPKRRSSDNNNKKK